MFPAAFWQWKLHIPRGKLHVDSNCLTQGVVCGDLVRGMALSFCLYHCVVGLERAVEVCPAMGQMEVSWPTTQHCVFHGTRGTGIIQTMVDPKDMSPSGEPLLQPGRVLNPTKIPDHTNVCENPNAWWRAGR